MKGNMQTRLLFSVLIANYNNGRFLQEAVDSVFAQSYSNWEIILVDDKSTDNSFEIYDKYKDDSRFHVFFNEENKGCGYTKRRCAELANGELCGFLDPDDELLPNALECHLNAHKEDPLVSVVYSRSYYCDRRGNITGESKLLTLKEGETYFDYRWYGSMCFSSYKNSFYKQTEGISEKLLAGVDQDLYFKIEEVGKICVLNVFTYKYYQRNEKAITKNDSKLWYWNLVARKAACERRGLNVDEILGEDLKYIFDCIRKDASFEKEKEIRSSRAYRLGRSILKPFSCLIKR